jgi:hypothetical protein
MTALARLGPAYAQTNVCSGSEQTLCTQAGSICCIRMRNRDIVELFEKVPPYTPVEIKA